MKRLRNAQSGFTIIELLIVIVVIGILAALVLNAFGNIQERARDTERRSDINSIHTQLEVFYTDNTAYPCDFNDLPNLSDEAKVAPNSGSGETYNYVTTAACNASVNESAVGAADGGDAAEYRLNADLEAEAVKFERDSLNGDSASLAQP